MSSGSSTGTSMADPVNSTASWINRMIAGMNSAGVQFVMSLLIADFPFLSFPPLKLVLGWVLGYLDGYLSKAEQIGATFIVIDTQISLEEANLAQAVKDLLTAQKSGDTHAIAMALTEFKAAQKALVTSDGSATPQ